VTAITANGSGSSGGNVFKEYRKALTLREDAAAEEPGVSASNGGGHLQTLHRPPRRSKSVGYRQPVSSLQHTLLHSSHPFLEGCTERNG